MLRKASQSSVPWEERGSKVRGRRRRRRGSRRQTAQPTTPRRPTNYNGCLGSAATKRGGVETAAG